MIDEVAGVVESAVFGVPHPDFGEAVVVALVTTDEFDAHSVPTALGSRLARFKHPKEQVIVDELPRNTMGKVQKGALRERYASLFSDT